MEITAARAAVVGRALVVACIMVSALAPGAAAEQASQPGWPPAAGLDAGTNHTCALLTDGGVRCWGFSGDGELGYGNRNTIGDDETPASAGPVSLGAARTATAIAAGDYHTCALLDDGSVRCWGLGADGRLGYGNIRDVGDDEVPGSVGPVFLGTGRARAITAGGSHTCALLDNGSVRCWGFAYQGQLGNSSQVTIGDTETPGSVPVVDLGGHTAKAISAGEAHTCALLDNDSVLCWGDNSFGQLGYGNNANIGDDEAPGSVGPVNFGVGRTATAIGAGGSHTCALLNDASVRCWGLGRNGQLGYGDTNNIADSARPNLAGPVNLGRSASAISAGGTHTCARLDDGSVRCWGNGGRGRLGYGSTMDVGDDELPSAVSPVNLGPGRQALAVSPGQSHTCARLDDGSVRCWGYGGNGRLGYCNENDIGDDEAPGSVGPVDLGSGGAACAAGSSVVRAPVNAPQSAVRPPLASSDAVRARGLRGCLAALAQHAKRELSASRRPSPRLRAGARRHARRHARSGRRRCLRTFARSPGPVTGLHARALGRTHIELRFNAPGTDANRPPPARSYLIKQSLRPLRTVRDFNRAQTLCKGSCRFTPSRVGGRVVLTVTDLHPRTTYYYALAARDNVSAHRGARSRGVKIKTR